jgi:hypothetical protein
MPQTTRPSICFCLKSLPSTHLFADNNRQTFDNFFFDEAFENFNFFIYIYDQKEQNIEKGTKLISQNKIELRAEYHQVKIIRNLSRSGR